VQELGGIGNAREILSKGFHLNVLDPKGRKTGEALLRATRVDGTIQISVSNFGKIMVNIKYVEHALSTQTWKALAWAHGVISSYGHNPKLARRIAEMNLIIEALTSGNYTVIR